MTIIHRPNGVFQARVVNRKLLGDRKVTRTFPTEAKARSWREDRLAELKRGFVHKDLLVTREAVLAPSVITLGMVMQAYQHAAPVSDCDSNYMNANMKLVGSTLLTEFNYKWAEALVERLKHERNLSPATIKTRIGALKRCIDWALNTENYPELTQNYLMRLRRGYSGMTARDQERLRKAGKVVKLSEARSRRLEEGEEARILQALAGEIEKPGKRLPALEHQAAIEFLFHLAVNSAMRLSEMFTLNLGQVDEKKSTILLFKDLSGFATKNGEDRQVPMNTRVVAKWAEYKAHVEAGTRGMEGFNFNGGLVFPFWDGDRSDAAVKKASARLSQRYQTLFQLADVRGFHFHDLRHEATSRLVLLNTMTDVQVMSITGHKSFQMFQRYTNLRGNDLVHRVG